jgi:hypothetical protein
MITSGACIPLQVLANICCSNYKLTDTAQDEESSEYDQYLFNVRRTFDWEGKYKVRKFSQHGALEI